MGNCQTKDSAEAEGELTTHGVSCSAPNCIQNFEGERVVVIGGGYAGQAISSLLDGDFTVTVLDPRDKLVHKIGGVRACVRPEWSEVVLVPQNRVMIGGHRLSAIVQSVNLDLKKVMYVVPGSKQSIELPYDYLVVASGGQSMSPAEPQDLHLKEHYYTVAEKISSAEKIVLIGGGPVGVEIAGEILAKHPTKDLIIVHAGPKLCDHVQAVAAKEFNAAIQYKLEQKGAKVILNDKVRLSRDDFKGKSYLEGERRTVFLASGKKVDGVDLVINCGGYVPNTSFMPAKCLNEAKLIRVDDNLRIPGYDNVFAIGDCNDVNETKTYVVCGTQEGKSEGWPRGHADVVAENIRLIAEKREKLTSYKPNNSWFGMIVPVGPNDAVVAGYPEAYGQYKCADYFTGNQWEAAKLKTPPMPPM